MDERICINAPMFSINLNSTTSKRCMINALSSFLLFAQQKRPPRRYPGASGPRNVSLGHRKKYQIVPCEVDVHQATQKKNATVAFSNCVCIFSLAHRCFMRLPSSCLARHDCICVKSASSTVMHYQPFATQPASCMSSCRRCTRYRNRKGRMHA
jgi:hypothetical protein